MIPSVKEIHTALPADPQHALSLHLAPRLIFRNEKPHRKGFVQRGSRVHPNYFHQAGFSALPLKLACRFHHVPNTHESCMKDVCPLFLLPSRSKKEEIEKVCCPFVVQGENAQHKTG